jgi:hypothetical protein
MAEDQERTARYRGCAVMAARAGMDASPVVHDLAAAVARDWATTAALAVDPAAEPRHWASAAQQWALVASQARAVEMIAKKARQRCIDARSAMLSEEAE